MMDRELCIFYATIFISFSIGVHLQSVIDFSQTLWIFTVVAVILLVLGIFNKDTEKKK